MFEQVKDILSKYTQEPITPESTFSGDLGLSSFDVVSVVEDFEDVFDLEISDQDIQRFIAVKDLIEYLQDRT